MLHDWEALKALPPLHAFPPKQVTTQRSNISATQPRQYHRQATPSEWPHAHPKVIPDTKSSKIQAQHQPKSRSVGPHSRMILLTVLRGSTSRCQGCTSSFPGSVVPPSSHPHLYPWTSPPLISICFAAQIIPLLFSPLNCLPFFPTPEWIFSLILVSSSAPFAPRIVPSCTTTLFPNAVAVGFERKLILPKNSNFRLNPILASQLGLPLLVL